MICSFRCFMLLSIITINYNNKNGLQKTIDSVVSQSFRDFEWIVIDGGSTDGSRELIEQYADHFAFWISEPDTGIYNAMNKGIKAAKGEYILFLNSGDALYQRRALESVLSESFDEDILYCPYYTSEGTYKVPVEEKNLTLFYLIKTTIHHSGGSFIKRELFDRYGLYDETLKIVPDWKWFFQAIGIGEASVRRINIPLSLYDISGISSVQIGLRVKEREQVIQESVHPRLIRDYENYCKLSESISEREDEVRRSRSYRVGHFVLSPLRFLKQTVQSIRKKVVLLKK